MMDEVAIFTKDGYEVVRFEDEANKLKLEDSFRKNEVVFFVTKQSNSILYRYEKEFDLDTPFMELNDNEKCGYCAPEVPDMVLHNNWLVTPINNNSVETENDEKGKINRLNEMRNINDGIDGDEVDNGNNKKLVKDESSKPSADIKGNSSEEGDDGNGNNLTSSSNTSGRGYNIQQNENVTRKMIESNVLGKRSYLARDKNDDISTSSQNENMNRPIKKMKHNG
nr:11396_t:CDS:2 [Entrophospora candida]